MTRSEQLRAALTDSFGERVIFAVEPANDAGFEFQEFGVWRVIVHTDQMAAMADALSDAEWALFIRAFIALAENVLALVEDDPEDIMFDAQRLTADAMPEAYMILDSVFSVE